MVSGCDDVSIGGVRFSGDPVQEALPLPAAGPAEFPTCDRHHERIPDRKTRLLLVGVGAEAARFLQALAEYLEQPLRLLI